MIDKRKTINELLADGYAIAVFMPVTLLTDDEIPLPIAALDVTVTHQSLVTDRHDSKPWKTAVGVANIAQANAQSQQFLATAAADTITPGLMAKLTTI